MRNQKLLSGGLVLFLVLFEACTFAQRLRNYCIMLHILRFSTIASISNLIGLKIYLSCFKFARFVNQPHG